MDSNTRFWIFTILIALGVGATMFFYLQKKEVEEAQEVHYKKMHEFYLLMPEERQQSIQEVSAVICDCIDSLDSPVKDLNDELKHIFREITSSKDKNDIISLLMMSKGSIEDFEHFTDCAGISNDAQKWDCWDSIHPDLDKKRRPILYLRIINSKIDCPPAQELLTSFIGILEAVILKEDIM